MIVLDASAVVALQDRRDACYAAALEAVRDETGPFVVPLAILAVYLVFLWTRVRKSRHS